MQLLALVAVVAVVGCLSRAYALEIPEEMKIHARKLHKKCQREVGVTDDTINMAKTGKLPDVREMKCYMYCMFDKVGLIDDKHQIHLEFLVEILPESMHAVVKNLDDKCGHVRGTDGCDSAFKTVQCYAETDPELFQSVMSLN